MEAKLKNSTEIDSLMDHSEASPYSLRDEADTVCANANERKCQISQRPVQDTESQRSGSVRPPPMWRSSASRCSRTSVTVFLSRAV